MYSTSNIFKLFTLVCSLFFICSASVFSFSFLTLDYYYIISLLVIVSALLLSGNKKKQITFKNNEIDKKSILYYFTIILLLFVSTRVSEFLIREIWLDEYTQFTTYNSSSLEKVVSIVDIAFYQQQPPLSYYLSNFSYEFLGWSKFSARFFSIASSLFSFILLYLFALKYNLKNYSFLLLGLFFTLDNYNIVYSVEGRPYALAMMLTIFLIDSWLDFLKKINLNSYIYLLGTSSVLTLAIGVQPQSILISMFLSYFITNIKNVKSILKLLSLFIIVLLFNIPMLYKIISSSSDQNLFNINITESINQYLEVFSFQRYLHHFSQNTVIGFFILIVFIASIFKAYIHKTKSKHRSDAVSLALISLAAPIVISLLLIIFVEWEYIERYFLCIKVTTLISFSICLNYLIGDKHKIYSFFSKYKTMLLTTVVCITILNPLSKRDIVTNLPWSNLYKSIKEDHNQEDIVIMDSLGDPGRWRLNLKVGWRISFPSLVNKDGVSNYKGLPLHIPDLSVLKKDCNHKKNMFIIENQHFAFSSGDVLKISIDSLYNKKIFDKKLSLIKIPLKKGDKPILALKEYYENVVKNNPNKDWTIGAYETLALINYEIGNIEKAKKYVQKISFIWERFKQKNKLSQFNLYNGEKQLKTISDIILGNRN